ncbi:hypothetical protein M8360_29225 [Klebsiella pneumoniae]|nr:hypothetical protein [Klebsiella pneumoniae]
MKSNDKLLHYRGLN